MPTTPVEGGEPRSVLRRIARQAMLARGLDPDFPADAVAELAAIRSPAPAEGAAARDLRGLPWCSIDNDDSRDLDQLSAAESLARGSVRLLVAIADVDALVRAGRPLDRHAEHNTASVYTAAGTFPMLPARLSTDLTSLNPDSDRLALVADLLVRSDGSLERFDLYRALVRNRAQLAYPSVGGWLERGGPPPAAVEAVPGLAANLRLQDEAARRLRSVRHHHGALSLETVEARPVFAGEELRDFTEVRRNRATDLIEDLMIAANGATARFLSARRFPSLRRVVRTPRHWERIVELAAERGAALPPRPDAPALERFLQAARASDPAGFAHLSLSVIKLIGKGEYVVELPGRDAPGHFGLAVRDYAHSTAPNRRFPDLVTQRLLKAALAGGPPPYGDDALERLARHCTDAEDAAKKVERQVEKSAAAFLLRDRIGEQFDAVVTGAAEKGTWVRLFRPPVEGRLVVRCAGCRVGDRVRVRLVSTDAERGHIDFERIDGR